MPRPTEAAAPGGRRRDVLRNEARIVAAATHLLADEPEATMQDLADAAGLGRATVYRHFPTREALLEAIGRAAIDEIGSALAGERLHEGDPVAALGRVVEVIFVVGDRYRVIAEGPPAGKTAEMHARAAAAFGPVEALIRRAQGEGALAADVPAEWIVAATGALIATGFRQVAAGTVGRDDVPGLVVRTLLRGFAGGRAGG
ncbi:MAG: TetR/AcrR family transcriptional regulator [Thermoleophilia bacterium]|nr:TetR/AcrR family transcriptional regulator [Thermoleophilia bacterium]